MVKLAMIGAGGYAFELIKRIWEIPQTIELVGVSSSPSRKSAGRTACQEKGVPVYADVDELLDHVKGKAEVIFVPTPIQTHYALAKLCLEKGFDVWLEKPPVATIQELDGLIELSEKYGKAIPVAFQSLYSTVMQKMKTRIASGEFGPITRVKAMAGWPRLDSYYNRSGWAGKLKMNGDWILDGTINNPLAHMLSNGLYLATQDPDKMAKPVSVEAELYHGHNIESEDTSSLRIITDTGIEVIFNATLCSDERTSAVTVVECEKATLEYKDFCNTTITFQNGSTEQIIDNSEQRIHMLQSLADSFVTGTPYKATLETCRPFTLAVNGAFESCGRPHAIPKKYIELLEQGDEIKTEIKGIDHVLEVAHANGKLFSELNIEWSKKSEIFNLTGYKQFPVRFQ